MKPDLRARLTALARRARISTIPDTVATTYPQSELNDTIYFEGRIVKRKRIVLLAPRCVSATCTMCPLPNEAIDPKYRNISAQDMISQVEKSFTESKNNDCEIITIYNNGNFFSENEVPKEARQYIYKKVSSLDANVLIVESLPQFITEEKIDEAKKYLANKKLVVAIGLQSSNDLVRELAINSTCTRKSFEKAIAILRNHGYSTQAFLLIKPPFLTEREAILDTTQSIQYLASLGIHDPILCTTRVAPNTVLEIMREKGLYSPPWLWTVIEIIKQSRSLVPETRPRIVVSELENKQNPDSECSANCQACNDHIISELKSYNESGCIEDLIEITCACKTEYDRLEQAENIQSVLNVEERIVAFLKTME